MTAPTKTEGINLPLKVSSDASSSVRTGQYSKTLCWETLNPKNTSQVVHVSVDMLQFWAKYRA